jgi:hypothetical protein
MWCTMVDDRKACRQAIGIKDAELWEKAKEEEFDAMSSAGVYEIRDLSDGRWALSCKCGLTRKRDEFGNVTRVSTCAGVSGSEASKCLGQSMIEYPTPKALSPSFHVLVCIAGLCCCLQRALLLVARRRGSVPG